MRKPPGEWKVLGASLGVKVIRRVIISERPGENLIKGIGERKRRMVLSPSARAGRTNQKPDIRDENSTNGEFSECSRVTSAFLTSSHRFLGSLSIKSPAYFCFSSNR